MRRARHDRYFYPVRASRTERPESVPACPRETTREVCGHNRVCHESEVHQYRGVAFLRPHEYLGYVVVARCVSPLIERLVCPLAFLR